MPTTVDEIAPSIYRLSTLVSEIGPTGSRSTSSWLTMTSRSSFTPGTDHVPVRL